MKPQKKNAIEIADAIKQRLGKSELKIGVFADHNSWRARVYSDASDAVPLQKRVDGLVSELRKLYELSE
jgi:hypothetical protein